jgi:superfamily II DNA or RNA helicase
LKLRPYQERAIQAVRAEYARHNRRVLLVAPTGFGKTAVASVMILWARAKGRRVLFLVHRREILADTRRRLEALGLRVGMILAGEVPDHDADVQLASVQTITARKLVPDAKLIIWDEAHHCAADTYREIDTKYPTAWHLGLTATPMRRDKKGLGDAFDVLVEGATVAELTAGGFLAPCDALRPEDAIDRHVDHITGGTIALDPVQAVKEYAAGRRCVVFQRLVAFSQDCAYRGGDRWAHLDADTPSVVRADILNRFARGDIDVISNVFILTEGWDCPGADTAVLARSFSAPSTYLQAVGRVLRVAPENPTKRALIVDLGNNVIRHGMPADKRKFSLHGNPIELEETTPTCFKCGANRRPGATECWSCGMVFPVSHLRVEVLDVPLVEHKPNARIHRDAMTDRMRDELYLLEQRASEKGYKYGWVSHVFRAKFGAYPPWSSGK